MCVRGLIETGCHVHIEEQMNKAGFIRAGSCSPPCVQVGCWLIEFISVFYYPSAPVTDRKPQINES